MKVQNLRDSSTNINNHYVSGVHIAPTFIGLEIETSIILGGFSFQHINDGAQALALQMFRI